MGNLKGLCIKSCAGKTFVKETQSEHYTEKLHLLFYCVLIGVFVLLLALVLLVWAFVSLETEYSTSGYFERNVKPFSIPCDDLSLSPDEDCDLFDIQKHKFKYSIQGDRYICTFSNLTEIIQKFVQRIGRLRVSQGLETKPYLQCGNENLKPASGYLTATFSKVSGHHLYKEQDVDHIIFWDKHPESAFIAENLNYHKGKVRVPEGRFYFVYAAVLINITDRFETKRLDTNRGRKISLQICVSSQGHERTLLYTSNVFSSVKNDGDVVSSLSVASHVLLAKEEDVYVKVSNAEGLFHNSKGNSFGIFPLY